MKIKITNFLIKTLFMFYYQGMHDFDAKLGIIPLPDINPYTHFDLFSIWLILEYKISAIYIKKKEKKDIKLLNYLFKIYAFNFTNVI